MPNGILPDQGIGAQLEYILKSSITGVLPWELWLWINDLEPDNTTVLEDITEATFGGYHRVTLQRSQWTSPTVNEGCATSYAGTVPIVWTVGTSSPQTIYGCAYVDRSSNLLRYIQRFDDGDIITTEIGMEFSLLPQYTLTSAACGATRRTRGTRAAERRRGIRR
jgi:hypothetical protein